MTQPAKLLWAIWAGPTLLEAQAEGARAFRARFPNVTFETIGFRAEQDVLTPWLGGSGPDVSMTWGSWLVDTGRRGTYVTLDPYIKRDSRAVPLQDYVEFQLRAHHAPEIGRYALPMFLPIYILFYHKLAFLRKGLPLPDDNLDWQKHADLLLRVTDHTQGVWGGLHTGFRHGFTKLYQNGAEVVDARDDRKAAFASTAGIEALQWIHDRLWKDRSWAQSAEVSRAGFKDAKAMLAQGKLATWEQGTSWELGDMVKEHPDAVADWDLAVMPRGKQRAARTAIDAWSIWKGTKEADVAWEFMKFLQSTEWLDIQARLAGYQHPRISMQDHWIDVVKKNLPALAGKNLQALTHPVKSRYARPDAIFRNDGDAWRIIGEAWNASMVRNEVGVAAAFQDAARRIDATMGG